MTINGIALLFGRLNFLWPDQTVGVDEELGKNWFRALSAVEDDEVFEALPLLAQTVERRPSIAQIMGQAKVVRAGHSKILQLPEPKGHPPPAEIKAEIDALVGKLSIERPRSSASKALQQDQSPKQLERTEPLDPLQRLWLRTRKPSLTCAECGKNLEISDRYRVVDDALFHRDCVKEKAPA